MARPSRRDHLIETAITLFCEHGYHATGIDLLLDRAGVSKKTMYQHFRSKEELIYAALRQYDGVFRNNFMKAVEAAGKTPKEKLLAIFDVAHTWFNDNKFFGCMFINAIGEYSEKDSPIREISRQFKQLMWNYVAELAKEANVKEPEKLANELCLLLEGAIVTAQVSQKPEAAITAKEIGKKLIDDAMGE
ncbi:MAG: TetR family transcriptional regulator [Kordiimonadaceae bacterium]|nr:TetR family transcriptional regulator [Kordiimonadaceae bacterium]